jgi:FkbM family methyltransferase
MNSALKHAAAIALGIGLGLVVYLHAGRINEWLAWILIAKPACGSPGLAHLRKSSRAWGSAEDKYTGKIRLLHEDAALRIAQYEVGGESFWVPIDGAEMKGDRLLLYLLVEHEWMEHMNPKEQVKQGDVVLDCGAHVGVFAKRALRNGAARVLAIEPAPLNLECLKRNLSAEIQSGRVIISPKGAWDSHGKLRLKMSKRNSGNNSLVYDLDRQGESDIEVTTIDEMVAEAKLTKVDYIKLDIEGAERRALRGGAKTITAHRPILALEFYHLEDDPIVLPNIVRGLVPDYRLVLGPCFSGDGRGWRPHIVYFQ